MEETFLYKHCAECGKRIPHTEIRCVQHRIQDWGEAGVKTVSLGEVKQ